MKNKVRGPILPINITIHKSTSPISLICEVIPIDSPTVPKADTTSNARGKKEIFSVTVNRNKKTDYK